MRRPSADAVAGNGAKRPLRRRRRAKGGMGGGEGMGQRLHPHPNPPPSRGRELSSQRVNSYRTPLKVCAGALAWALWDQW